MKQFAKVAMIVAVGVSLAACVVTVPNPFGGAPLVLTGHLAADMPGIKAYAADLRVGIKADAVAVRAAFIQYCPTVDEVATAAGTVTPGQVVNASGGLITATAASKQIGNAQKGIGTAQLICAGGTATDLRTAFVDFAQAATQVYGWIKGRQD